MGADRVGLVDEDEGAVSLGDRGQGLQRGQVAVHRVERFERHDAWPARVEAREPRVEVGRIVVGEDLDPGPAAPHALDHGRVVVRVGEERALRQLTTQRREAGVVGRIAR